MGVVITSTLAKWETNRSSNACGEDGDSECVECGEIQSNKVLKLSPRCWKTKHLGCAEKPKKNILKGKRQRASGATESYDNNNNSVDSRVENQLHGYCRATLYDRRESLGEAAAPVLQWQRDLGGGGPEVENPWRRIYIVPQGEKKYAKNCQCNCDSKPLWPREIDTIWLCKCEKEDLSENPVITAQLLMSSVINKSILKWIFRRSHLQICSIKWWVRSSLWFTPKCIIPQLLLQSDI